MWYTLLDMITKAIIPIAGRGTRFLPITRVVPKELIPLIDRPVIQHIVEECALAGAREIIFVVNHHNGDMVKKYFNSNHARYMYAVADPMVRRGVRNLDRLLKKLQFYFVVQRTLRGDGDAFLAARHFIKKNDVFFASMGDLLLERKGEMKELARVYVRTGVSAVAVERVPRADVVRYGVIKTTGRGLRVVDIVEKPTPQAAPSTLALVGKYVLTAEIFEKLAQLRPDAYGEIKLAYALRELAREGKLLAHQIRGTHYDCGSIPGFLRATIHASLHHPQYTRALTDIKRLR